MSFNRRHGFRVFGAVLAALLAACATSSTPPPTADIRNALAPSGALRIAVYPGSPTSMVKVAGSEEVRGVTIDIGREMARRLGVPAEIVVFESAGQIVEAVRSGKVDMTITNATAARAALVDFSATVLSLELGFLVMPTSPVTAIDKADQPGHRIGVSAGSSSLALLSRTFKFAQVVPAPTLATARQMLADKQLDAFATNKAILFEMSDALPLSRVMDGSWGMEHAALAVPKGRTVAANWITSFVNAVRDEGLVQAAAQRAGLRGLAK